MRLASIVLILVTAATAWAESQPVVKRALVAAAPVKDPTRWKPAADPRSVVVAPPVADPNWRVMEVATADGKSALVSVVLPLGVTVAGIGVLPLVDRMDFRTHGAANTAWNALGWTGIAAFVIGPSLGQIYAGNPWNTGLKIRLIGAVSMGTGITIGATGPHSGAATPTNRGAVGLLIALLGAIPYIGGSLYEIGTSPRSVRAYNERARRTPIIVVPVAAHATLGVTLVGSF